MIQINTNTTIAAIFLTAISSTAMADNTTQPPPGITAESVTQIMAQATTPSNDPSSCHAFINQTLATGYTVTVDHLNVNVPKERIVLATTQRNKEGLDSLCPEKKGEISDPILPPLATDTPNTEKPIIAQDGMTATFTTLHHREKQDMACLNTFAFQNGNTILKSTYCDALDYQ